MMMATRLLIAALLVAGAAALWWVNRPEPVHPDQLELFGNVDIRQVDLSFRVAGRLEQVLVDEGDAVSAGDTVATLEEADFTDAVGFAEAQLAAQQATLDALLAGSRPEEIAQAEADVEQARAALRFAQSTLDRQATLAERDFTPFQVLDEAQMQVDLARTRLQAALATLALVESGPREEEIRAARAQRDALAVSLELARRRLADTALIAPNDGRILTRVREPGAVIGAGEPVFTLSLNSPVWIRAYVEEPDLGHVVPGSVARVTTDSGYAYEGRIGFVSPTAEFTPRSVQTRELRTSLVYRVRIVVDNPDAGLRQGMPVTVQIDVTDIDD